MPAPVSPLSSSARRRAPAARSAESEVEALYAHPGFLLRRAHQIAASTFVRDTGGVITPPQFSALQLVAVVPGIDVMAISRIIGLDRTTSALVVGNLVKSGWVSRSADPQDRRRWLLHLTAEGAALIDRLRPLAEASERRLLSAFSKADQRLLLAVLRRFVDSFNDLSPAPVDGNELPRARSRLRQV